MQIYYLEIVTKDVDAACAVYAAANGLEFGNADATLAHMTRLPTSRAGEHQRSTAPFLREAGSWTTPTTPSAGRTPNMGG